MSGKGVRETLAALGVIASLVFVGVEIRQNTTVARSQTRQALADASLALISDLTADEDISRDWWDWVNAEQDAVLDCGETRMCIFMAGLARHHENVFLQTREGLVDETVLESYGFSGNRLYRSPYWPQYWSQIRQIFHPDFVTALEAEYGLAP